MELGERGHGMNNRLCEVCGRPSRFVAAFPSTTDANGAPVYDGGAVCSPECAQELKRRHETSAQEHQERAPVPGEGDELGTLDWRIARDAVQLGTQQRQRERARAGQHQQEEWDNGIKAPQQVLISALIDAQTWEALAHMQLYARGPGPDAIVNQALKEYILRWASQRDSGAVRCMWCGAGTAGSLLCPDCQYQAATANPLTAPESGE